MFHANVGISAWGLAINGLSRLVAVSSNLSEVTVFMFGLREEKGAFIPLYGHDIFPPYS